VQTELVHLGFGNIIPINRVVALISPNSAPNKRLVQDGKSKGLVIDMTNGRRTRATLFMDSGHIILAAIAPETIAGRVAASKGKPEPKTE
jgi:hypothetical protein